MRVNLRPVAQNLSSTTLVGFTDRAYVNGPLLQGDQRRAVFKDGVLITLSKNTEDVKSIQPWHRPLRPRFGYPLRPAGRSATLSHLLCRLNG